MGWASGFRAGSDMARSWIDTYREAEERRRLKEIEQARPETGLGYTAEQGQQLERLASVINPETGQPYYQLQAQPGGLGYQVTPQFEYEGRPAGAAPVETGIRPELTTDFLGRRYAGQITPDQETAGRLRAQADVVALRNPAEAQRMRLLATQEERAAAKEQREIEDFATSQKIRGLQLSRAEREEQDAIKLTTATTEIAALGRPPSMDDIRTIATRNNLSIDQQFKLGQNLTGIAEADAKMLAADISKKIKGKNLDGLLALHKDDPTFDDNSYFEKTVGRNGQITLTQRSKEGQVLGTTSFKNAAEATAYLTQQATDPGNVFNWLQASRLKESQIAENEARAAYLTAGGGRSTRPEYTNNDIRNYIKDNEDKVVGKDPRTGKDMLFRDLSEEEQRARAVR